MDNLIQTLIHATSQSMIERAPAEDQLAAWGKQQQFHSMLLQIYLQSSLDLKVRSLAIIVLKNGVSKYWRKGASFGIVEQEKLEIRKLLLLRFNEPSKQLAAHQAVVISKIARFDCPTFWPDLLPSLLHLVQSSFTDAKNITISKCEQYNALYTLHLSMKQVAARPLPAAREILRQIAPEVFAFMHAILKNRISLFKAGVQSGEEHDSLDFSLSIARIALKCMRRLIYNGFSSILQTADPLNFLESATKFLQEFLEYRVTFNGSKAMLANFSSLSILIGKALLDLQMNDFRSFVLVPGCRNVLKFYFYLLQQTTHSTGEIIVPYFR